MSVIARPTSGSRLRRRRGSRPDEFQVTDRRPAGAAGGVAALRRRVDPPQDEALYTCECGFQFAASVSTSVACPHCGGAQAW